MKFITGLDGRLYPRGDKERKEFATLSKKARRAKLRKWRKECVFNTLSKFRQEYMPKSEIIRLTRLAADGEFSSMYLPGLEAKIIFY